MAIGGSGVTSNGATTDTLATLRELLAGIGDVDTYQQRLDTLEGAENRALKAKSEANQAVRAATLEAEKIVTEAKANADEILRDARASEVEGRDMLKSEQATHQHNVEAWNAERRSKQGQLGAATNAAKKAKENAEKAEANAISAKLDYENRKSEIEAKWSAAKQAMA